MCDHAPDGITDAASGSVRGLHLVLKDIVAARNEYVDGGVDVEVIRYLTPDGRVTEPHMKRSEYESLSRSQAAMATPGFSRSAASAPVEGVERYLERQEATE